MKNISITAISDLHGFQPELDGGDLLIIAGDITGRDTVLEWALFFHWLKKQNYKKKILIAGNHDGFLESGFPKSDQEAEDLKEVQDFLEEKDEELDFEYLCDSGTEYKGLKIWGSPWTPEFMDWHFMKKRGKEMKAVWDKVPKDTDILITHGPPYGILDRVDLSSRGDEFDHAGDEELRTLLEKIQPKLHVFGHIHSEGGKQMIYKRPGYGTENNTLCVNAAIMDESYIPCNKPVNIIWSPNGCY